MHSWRVGSYKIIYSEHFGALHFIQWLPDHRASRVNPIHSHTSSMNRCVTWKTRYTLSFQEIFSMLVETSLTLALEYLCRYTLLHSWKICSNHREPTQQLFPTTSDRLLHSMTRTNLKYEKKMYIHIHHMWIYYILSYFQTSLKKILKKYSINHIIFYNLKKDFFFYQKINNIYLKNNIVLKNVNHCPYTLDKGIKIET